MFTDILKLFFDRLKKAIADDASSKGQKAPIDKLRIEVDDKGGRLFAPHYFKYIATGRGPGKQPPPDAMLEFVQKNPEIYAQAKATFKYLTEPQLAFLIGRKIGREGTDIYQGKKPGLDLLTAIENTLPEAMKELARGTALEVQTALKSAIK